MESACMVCAASTSSGKPPFIPDPIPALKDQPQSGGGGGSCISCNRSVPAGEAVELFEIKNGFLAQLGVCGGGEP